MTHTGPCYRSRIQTMDQSNPPGLHKESPSGKHKSAMLALARMNTFCLCTAGSDCGTNVEHIHTHTHTGFVLLVYPGLKCEHSGSGKLHGSSRAARQDSPRQSRRWFWPKQDARWICMVGWRKLRPGASSLTCRVVGVAAAGLALLGRHQPRCPWFGLLLVPVANSAVGLMAHRVLTVGPGWRQLGW